MHLYSSIEHQVKPPVSPAARAMKMVGPYLSWLYPLPGKWIAPPRCPHRFASWNLEPSLRRVPRSSSLPSVAAFSVVWKNAFSFELDGSIVRFLSLHSNYLSGGKIWGLRHAKRGIV